MIRTIERLIKEAVYPNSALQKCLTDWERVKDHRKVDMRGIFTRI